MEEILRKWGFHGFFEKNPNWSDDHVILKTLIYRDYTMPDGTITKLPFKDSKTIVSCLKNKNIIIYKDPDNNKSWKFNTDKKQEFYYKSRSYDQLFMNIVHVKIKSYETSALLFGNSKIKKSMMETKENFIIGKLNLQHPCKKDGSIRNLIEVIAPNGRNIKFVEEDIEFIYPDINSITKGYNIPLDRTIRNGSKVKIYKKNTARISYGTKAVVESVNKTGNKKYCKIITENKKSYIIEQSKIRVIC